MVDEITDARVNVDGVDTRSDADRHHGHLPVVIVGGGQAGLSTSWLLKKRGIAHVVLEKHRIGHATMQVETSLASACALAPDAVV